MSHVFNFLTFVVSPMFASHLFNVHNEDQNQQLHVASSVSAPAELSVPSVPDTGGATDKVAFLLSPMFACVRACVSTCMFVCVWICACLID